MQIEPGALYITSTPIGNLEDITLRALSVLREVDFILCEDTRTSVKLLNHYEIKNHLIAYHKFNELSSCERIVEMLRSGQSGALISDAGTPLISDPGLILIKRLIEEAIPYYVLPGANALLPALICSGFDTEGFFFRGFLPKKNSRRREELTELLQSKSSVILYAAPHEIDSLLAEIERLAPERQLSASKELTKLYETTYRGTAEELRAAIGEAPKGEFVLVVSGCGELESEAPDEEVIAAEFEELCETMPRSEAVRALANRYGLNRRELYAKLMK